MNLSIYCRNDQKFADAEMHLATAEAIEQRIEFDENKIAYDVRRKAKINFFAAKLAAYRGQAERALGSMRQVLAAYQGLDLMQFTTSGEAGEYFNYCRFAIALAIATGDDSGLQQIVEECVSTYDQARIQYLDFTNYRYFFGACMVEYAYHCQNSQSPELEWAVRQLEKCLEDWDEVNRISDDYWLLAMHFSHEWVSPEGWVSDELRDKAAHHVLDRPFEKIPSDMITAMLEVRGPDFTTRYLSAILEQRPDSVRERWLLSRLANLDPGHRFYLAPEISATARQQVLAATYSYRRSQFDQIWSEMLRDLPKDHGK